MFQRKQGDLKDLIQYEKNVVKSLRKYAEDRDQGDYGSI
jgi:hypothetical protein